MSESKAQFLFHKKSKILNNIRRKQVGNKLHIRGIGVEIWCGGKTTLFGVVLKTEDEGGVNLLSEDCKRREKKAFIYRVARKNIQIPLA